MLSCSSMRLMCSNKPACINNNSTPSNQSFSFARFSNFSIDTCMNFRSSRYLVTNDVNRISQTDNNSKKGTFAIYCTSTDTEEDSISFGPILNSWKAWIVGGVLAVILPLLTKNRASLTKWMKSLESVEEKIEEIVEAVEKVGEEVEKVAEEIEEKLPDGGKLKSVVNSVEKVANQVVNEADKIEQLVDKVENMEKKMDAMIEVEADKSNAGASDNVETPSTE